MDAAKQGIITPEMIAEKKAEIAEEKAKQKEGAD